MTAHSDQTIRILVVDDHQVVRQGLRYLRPARHRHRRRLARWDRAHVQEFTLADGQRIGRPEPDFDTTDEAHDRPTTLGRLRAGEQFVSVFDFGDDWTRLCTVGDRRVDPLETLGILPRGPAVLLRLGRPARSVRTPLGQRRRRDLLGGLLHEYQRAA